MTLREFLNANTLLTDLYDIIDYNFLKGRMLARRGKCHVRDDLTATQVCEFAQNTVDINIDYFRAILENTPNPFKTWGEVGKSSNSGTSTNGGTSSGSSSTATTGTDSTENSGRNTVTTTGTDTTTNTGTITDSGTTHAETTTNTTTTNTDNTNTQNSVFAFNSETASPESTQTVQNTAENSTEQTAENDGTCGNTQTLDTQNAIAHNTTQTTQSDDTSTLTHNTTVTGTSSNTQSSNGTTSNNADYEKSGYNATDMLLIYSRYKTAYDIIVDYICQEILEPVVYI